MKCHAIIQVKKNKTKQKQTVCTPEQTERLCGVAIAQLSILLFVESFEVFLKAASVRTLSFLQAAFAGSSESVHQRTV